MLVRITDTLAVEIGEILCLDYLDGDLHVGMF